MALSLCAMVAERSPVVRDQTNSSALQAPLTTSLRVP